jgi:alkylation response protein AidB-like acyl-CoA dehydrogenase
MMGFDLLDDEQREIRDLVRALARERIAPRARRSRSSTRAHRRSSVS